MSFGERLVLAREKAHLNQKQLAEALNITPTRLNYWEKNKRQPDVFMIKALASTLNVSADYLIGNETNCSSFSAKEQSHIKKYRLLNEDGQVKTDDYMDDLLQVEQYRAGEKEEFSKPLAPDPTIDYDAAIEEAEAEIARTRYARIAAYGGKNMFVKEAADEEEEDEYAEDNDTIKKPTE